MGTGIYAYNENKQKCDYYKSKTCFIINLVT